MKKLLLFLSLVMCSCSQLSYLKNEPAWVHHTKSWSEATPLVWHAMVDDRPLYVQSVVVAREIENGWILEHIYRNNYSGFSEGDRWELLIIYTDSPIVGFKKFRAHPTNSEIMMFLSDSDWPNPVPEGWKTTEKGVNAMLWNRITGQNVPKILDK